MEIWPTLNVDLIYLGFLLVSFSGSNAGLVLLYVYRLPQKLSWLTELVWNRQ